MNAALSLLSCIAWLQLNCSSQIWSQLAVSTSLFLPLLSPCPVHYPTLKLLALCVSFCIDLFSLTHPPFAPSLPASLPPLFHNYRPRLVSFACNYFAAAHFV